MRTVIFFVALAIADLSDKTLPNGTGTLFAALLVIFLYMDFYELSKL